MHSEGVPVGREVKKRTRREEGVRRVRGERSEQGTESGIRGKPEEGGEGTVDKRVRKKAGVFLCGGKLWQRKS